MRALGIKVTKITNARGERLLRQFAVNPAAPELAPQLQFHNSSPTCMPQATALS